MTDDSRYDGASRRPCASPPCYEAEIQPEVAPETRPVPMTLAELTEALNTLIEAERAGARGLIEMQPGCPEAPLKQLMHQVACDEGHFCAMLTGHVVRLGGTASAATGQFFEKLMARQTLAERLALLDRGQSAVVRMLEDMLPKVADRELADDLREMRDVHVQNIARCAAFSGTGRSDRQR